MAIQEEKNEIMNEEIKDRIRIWRAKDIGFVINKKDIRILIIREKIISSIYKF